MCGYCGEVGKYFMLLNFDWSKRIGSFWLLGGSSYIKSSLPRPEDFAKALYTLDIGQNDLHGGFWSMTEKQVLASIPNIINRFALALEVTKIYDLYSFSTTCTFFLEKKIEGYSAICLSFGSSKCKLQLIWSMLWSQQWIILILNFIL